MKTDKQKLISTEYLEDILNFADNYERRRLFNQTYSRRIINDACICELIHFYKPVVVAQQLISRYLNKPTSTSDVEALSTVLFNAEKKYLARRVDIGPITVLHFLIYLSKQLAMYNLTTDQLMIILISVFMSKDIYVSIRQTPDVDYWTVSDLFEAKFNIMFLERIDTHLSPDSLDCFVNVTLNEFNKEHSVGLTADKAEYFMRKICEYLPAYDSTNVSVVIDLYERFYRHLVSIDNSKKMHTRLHYPTLEDLGYLSNHPITYIGAKWVSQFYKDSEETSEF